MNDEKGQVLQLPIFSTGENMKVLVDHTQCDFKSDFQRILVADTAEFGRCLIIDDVMQVAEVDHDLYDSELLRMFHPGDKTFLILGGGDGFVAKKILSLEPQAEILVVDLDIEVVKAAEEFFHQDVFRKDNVRLMVSDVQHSLRTLAGPFDGIICDLTDSPIGVNEQKDYVCFYEKILNKVAALLNEKGWVGLQSGASIVAPGLVDQVNILQTILNTYFEVIERTDLYVPSYGESCAFLFARHPKKKDK